MLSKRSTNGRSVRKLLAEIRMSNPCYDAPGISMTRMLRVRVQAISVLLTASLLSAVPVHGQSKPSQPGDQEDAVLQFLPEHAVITDRLKLKFEHGIKSNAEAVAFTLPPVYADSYNAGLKIIGTNKPSEWKVLYDETTELEPGEDEVVLKKVKARIGPEALVVILHHSGAGTVTDWKIIAAQAGKLRPIESRPIRDRVLQHRNSAFGGYNAVRIDGDTVVERIPMYSKYRSRCCPDRPSIEIHVRFTGSSLQLASVNEVPAER